MSNFVLDASALLAVLREEPGADVVKEAMATSQVSVINIGEVAQCLLKDGWLLSEIEETLNALGVRIRTMRLDLAFKSAAMREDGRKQGLSQADCICLALAKREGAIALTGDRKWLELSEKLGVEIRLIR